MAQLFSLFFSSKCLSLLLTLSMLVALVAVPRLGEQRVMAADSGNAFTGTLADLAQHPLLNGAVAFFLGEPLALAKGSIGWIDSTDRRVVAWLDPVTNRSYAPLRYVATAFDAEVSWDEANAQVTLRWQERTVIMRVGSNTVELGESRLALDAPPVLREGRVYLPLRGVATVLGKDIHFIDGLIIMQDAPELVTLQERGSELITLLGLKLQPLASVGSYEKLMLLLQSSLGGYQDYGEVDGIFDDSRQMELFTTAPAVGATGSMAAPPPPLASPNDMPLATPAPGGNTAQDAPAAERYSAVEKVEEASSYSETNLQVAGVDEADIIKTDGTYIYVVRANEALIISALPAEKMQILSRVSFRESVPLELYIEDNRMVIITQDWQEDNRWNFTRPAPGVPVNEKPAVMPTSVPRLDYDYYPYRNYQAATQMLIYDISNRSDPKLLREVEVEGNYLSSRRIDTCYYLVTNRDIDWWQIARYAYQGVAPADLADAAAPRYRDSLVGSAKQLLPYHMIRCFPEIQEANYLMVAAFDAAKNELIDIQAYLGAGATVYVSGTGLYVAASQSVRVESAALQAVEEAMGLRAPYRPLYENATRIFSFSLQGGKVVYQANGIVPGSLLNQFSLDEYQGHLRIATNRQPYSWFWGSGEEMRNQLYILDADLNVVGALEDIAPGERIYSARFMGGRAFLVTFRTVDPLFVID
ncbi:MAG: beta-propeller domain-containing protein, partial [Symbiobacteriaceae bacterium]|nr:beta-propeller domain-containing protein [Symbiobacteriaceae bacterium]